jgi:glycosyltransferase involved in cell wall biosynthesis
MKIALISPPPLKTPPSQYGGLEAVVYDLGCALVKGGDDVTLFAPPGSHIDGGKLFETVVAPERVDVNWIQLEGEAYNKYVHELEHFDIVHCHTWFAFPYLAKMTKPSIKICHTHHGHLDWKVNAIPPQIGKVNLIAISEYMSKEYQMQGWSSKYVYNGIDIDKYKYSDKKEDRFAFVGRISEFKQPDLAIRAAIAANTPIDIIGGSFVDKPAFLETIKTMCDNSNGIATLHLDLPNDKKVEIVQSAKASLVPSNFHEPFGLVACESLAMGTPVIALDDGALREVVGDNGKAGFVVGTEEQFTDICNKIGTPGFKITPQACRDRSLKFSRDNMANRYRKLYEQIISGSEW